MWSPSTASSLIDAAVSGLIELETSEVEGIKSDVSPSESGQAEAIKWLDKHNLNCEDILGVLCESDIGLRRK